MKLLFILGGIAVVYYLTKPSVKAGCVSAINPFTGRLMSSCAGTATGNAAGASLPIPKGPTNTDTGGLNSNGSNGDLNADYQKLADDYTNTWIAGWNQ